MGGSQHRQRGEALQRSSDPAVLGGGDVRAGGPMSREVQAVCGVTDDVGEMAASFQEAAATCLYSQGVGMRRGAVRVGVGVGGTARGSARWSGSAQWEAGLGLGWRLWRDDGWMEVSCQEARPGQARPEQSSAWNAAQRSTQRSSGAASHGWHARPGGGDDRKRGVTAKRVLLEADSRVKFGWPEPGLPATLPALPAFALPACVANMQVQGAALRCTTLHHYCSPRP